MDHLQATLIAHIRRYVSLTDEEAEKLLPYFRQRRLAKRDLLLRPGEVCRYESFVIKGCLRSFIIHEQGQEHVMQLAVEEAWISDFFSFVNDAPARLCIEALEPVVLLQVGRADLEVLYRLAPALERYFRLLHQNLYLKLSQRIVNNLSLPARERYVHFLQESAAVAARFPQKYIAAYLGMTPVMLSLVRKAIKEEDGSAKGAGR